MTEESNKRLGVIAAVQGLLRTLLESVETRLELLAVEFQEEKTRLAELIILIGWTISFAAAAMLMLPVALLILFWEIYWARVAIAILIPLVYGGLAWGGYNRIFEMASEASKPFNATLDQLKKDAEYLKKTKSE